MYVRGAEILWTRGRVINWELYCSLYMSSISNTQYRKFQIIRLPLFQNKRHKKSYPQKNRG